MAEGSTIAGIPKRLALRKPLKLNSVRILAVLDLPSSRHRHRRRLANLMELLGSLVVSYDGPLPKLFCQRVGGREDHMRVGLFWLTNWDLLLATPKVLYSRFEHSYSFFFRYCFCCCNDFCHCHQFCASHHLCSVITVIVVIIVVVRSKSGNESVYICWESSNKGASGHHKRKGYRDAGEVSSEAMGLRAGSPSSRIYLQLKL